MADKKTARRPLPQISSTAWEHPSDRLALNALRSIPAFDTLVRKVLGTFGERRLSIFFRAQGLKIDESQHCEIHALLKDSCEVLDVEVPDLYVSQSSTLPDSIAVGWDRPFIVVNSRLVERTSPEQLRAAIAHETANIASEHTLYTTLLYILLGEFGFPAVVRQITTPMRLALLEWHRKSRISADRGALLATQDPEAVIGMLATVAGGIRGYEIDIDAFVKQSEEYRDAQGLDGVFKIMEIMYSPFPFPVIRAAQLLDWVDNGDYNSIVAGSYVVRGEEKPFTDDVVDATQTFSDSAQKVFEDADRYVNDALLRFIGAAKQTMDDSTES